MISIDPATYVITVPQADLSPLGGTSYQLDTYQFHIWLKDWEDSEEGIFQPPTHNHNTAVTLGGIQYARVIEILSPYTVTFEDTGSPYKVFLTGSNNNILDVTNLNLVSVAPNNSAGLINITEVQYAAFGGGVSLDVTNGEAGTVYPIGTLRNPSNNLTDALAIAEGRGFETLFLHGALTLHDGDDVGMYTLRGEDKDSTTLTLEAGCITTGANLYDLTVTGTCGGRMNIHYCNIKDIVGLCASGADANINNCKLTGTIQFRSIADQSYNFTNCVGKYDLTLDANGCPAGVHFTDFAGLITLQGISNAAQSVQMDIDSGYVVVDSSCTDGAVTLRGIGVIDDNNAGTTINTDGLVQLADVQYASFDGAVHVDAMMGDDSWRGNAQYPVVTCAKAVEILNARGFKRVHVMSPFTFNSDADFPGCVIEGENKLTTTLTIEAGANVENCIFTNLTVTGTLDVNSMLKECVIEDLTYVEGDIHQCEVTGLLTCAGTAGLEIFNSYSGRQGTADPAIIDMDGPSTGAKNVAVHNWSGHMKVRNMTGGYLGISCSGGANIRIESTCTGGFIHIMGNCKVTDQSTGATVRTNYVTSPEAIAAAVGAGGGSWDQDLPNGYTEGQAGWVLNDIHTLAQSFQTALSGILARSYQAGVVAIPSAAGAGDTLTFHAGTDYDDVSFTIGSQWTPYLEAANAEVWFTVKTSPRQTTAIIDTTVTIVDTARGILELALSGSDTDIDPGTYFWQIQVRDPDAVPLEKRVAMEGTLYVKPVFK